MTVQDTPDGSITAVHPAKTPITVRQLLTHTAGLGYNIIQTGPLREAYNKAGLIGGQVSRLPIPGMPPITPAPTLPPSADRLAELPLASAPARRWLSSVGSHLLGRGIAEARAQG